MTGAKQSVNWPLRIVLLASIAVFGLLLCAFRELDPVTGEWRIDEATENGKIVPDAERWRVFLSIDGDHATIASYWTCGVRKDTFAEGIMVRRGDQVDLYRRVRMTPELESISNGHFQILPNRRIGYDIPGENGSTIHLIFRREYNAPTILDLLGWD